MQKISYVIKDELGIHARPAGELIKKAKSFESEITISKGDRSCSLKKLFEVMKLGVKQNDTIDIAFEGADEEKAATEVKAFLESHL